MSGKSNKQAQWVRRGMFPAICEAAWAVALRKEKFGYAEISSELSINLEQATRIVKLWVQERAIEEVQKGGGLRTLWRCRPGFGRMDAPSARTPEANMWTAMRRLRSFTPTDLAAHATTDLVQVSPSAAADYCRALLAVEYVSVVRPADPSRQSEAIYRMRADTGPKAPVIRRVRAVSDPNTGKTLLAGDRA